MELHSAQTGTAGKRVVCRAGKALGKGGLVCIAGDMWHHHFGEQACMPLARDPSMAQPCRGQWEGPRPQMDKSRELQDPTTVGSLGSAPWSLSDKVPRPHPAFVQVGTYSGMLLGEGAEKEPGGGGELCGQG